MQPKRRAIAGRRRRGRSGCGRRAPRRPRPGRVRSGRAPPGRAAPSRRSSRSAQRHAGEVGVDEERPALVGEPVAGDPEPFDLEPGGQPRRPRLELAQRLAVVALARALVARALASSPMCRSGPVMARPMPSASVAESSRRAGQRLEDDAVALGQLEQGRQLLLVGVGVELEARGGSRGSRPGRRGRRRGCRGSRGRPRRGPCPPATAIPSEVATARRVTPAQATSASSSMSPEQSSVPSPPEAGCSPASAIARPVSTEQETPSPSVALGREGDEGPGLGAYCSRGIRRPRRQRAHGR